jgi:hypothetical protein
MSNKKYLIDTYFLKYLFFDSYPEHVSNQDDSSFTAEVFSYFLEKLNQNNEYSNNLYTNTFKKFKYFNRDKYEESPNNWHDYNKYIKDLIIKDSNPPDSILLLGGYTSGKQSPENIYCELTSKDTYNVYLISYLGHKYFDKIVSDKSKNNFIIGFNNVNIENIKDLIKFTFILTNQELRNDLNRYKDDSTYFKNYRPEQYEEYKNLYDIYKRYLDDKIYKDVLNPEITPENYYKIIFKCINPKNLKPFINHSDLVVRNEYFMHYYTVKYLVFKKEDEFNKFILDVKIDIINFICKNLEYLNKRGFFVNILQILLKDYSKLISEDNKSIILDFMLKNYNTMYAEEKISNPNNKPDELYTIIEKYKYIKNICKNNLGSFDKSFIELIYDITRDLYIREKKDDFVNYLFVNLSKLVYNYSKNKIRSYNILESRDDINLIFTFIPITDETLKRTVQILFLYSFLNVNNKDIEFNKYYNQLNTSDESNLYGFIYNQIFINIYSNIDIDLEDLKNKIISNIGLLLNKKTSDFDPININNVFDHINTDKIFGHHIYPNQIKILDYNYHKISNYGTIEYTINQLNNNNFSEINNFFSTNTVSLYTQYNIDGLKYYLDSDNHIDYINNYFDESNSNDDLININDRDEFILYSHNNNNYKVIQSLVKKIDIDNFFKNIKLFKDELIEKILYLLYSYRYDEIKDTYLNNLDTIFPNSIAKYLYNSDYKKNNFPFISLLASEDYDKIPELVEIYKRYNLTDNKKIEKSEIMKSIYNLYLTRKDDDYDDIFFEQYIILKNSSIITNIPDYEVYDISNADILYNFSNYTCYQKNEDYYYLNSDFKYLIPFYFYRLKTDNNKSNIAKVINDVTYDLISDDLIPTNLKPLYIKLNNLGQIYIWKNPIDETIIFELINYDNLNFKCIKDAENYSVTFFTSYKEVLSFNKITNSYEASNQINKEYKVIYNKDLTYDNYLLGLWCYQAMNHFILYDNSDNSYNLLIITSKRYITASWPESYWSPDQTIPKLNHSNKYYILKFNFTLLNFDIQSFLYIPLLNSLLMSQNNLAIYLILNTATNIFRKLQLEFNNTEEITFFKYLINDPQIPYRFLFQYKIMGELTPKFAEREENFKYENKIDFTSSKIDITKNNKKQLSEVLKLSDNLIKIKEIMTDDKITIIEENKILQNFIKNFRGNCKKEELCKIELDDIDKELENESVIKDIMIDMLKSNNLFLVSNILLKHKDYFYQKLINNYFNNIYNDVSKNKKDCSCFIIHKAIESLDLNIIYDFDNERTIEVILFELTSGYFIRKEQKDLLYKGDQKEDKIIDDLNSDTNNKIYEILMGRGKTATITPLILLYNQFNTVESMSYFVVLPSHLTSSSFDILVKFSELFFNIFINTYSLDSNNDIKNDDKLIKINHINIISDENIKNYVLKSIIKNKSVGFIFNSKNIFIFDEIDSLIDPLKSNLNIPKESIDHDFKEFILENTFKIITNYFYNKKDNNYGIDNITDSRADLVEAYKNKMTYILSILRSQIYNQTYGYGNIKYSLDELINDKTSKYKCIFTAIPYSANNSPINSSEFTDFELLLSLTILSYYNKRLRDVDLLMYLNQIKTVYLTNKELSSLLYPNLSNYIDINFLDTYYNLDIKKQFDICNKLSINDSIKYNDNFLKDYINFIYYKFFKISKTQYNITMLDIFNQDICKKKFAFSGSTNINLPLEITNSFIDDLDKKYTNIHDNLLKEIVYDSITKGSIYSSLYGITRKDESFNKIITYSSNDKELIIEDNFITYILLEDTLKNYGAIIDTAGLIINTNPIDLVKKIYKKFTDLKDENKISNVKNILYINSDGDRMIYNINSKVVNQKYNNEKYNNCFIYYDNKNTVGIDFKQPPNLIGLLTVSKMNNLTQISQGIYRLRNINYGHFVDFYVDEEIIKDVPDTEKSNIDIYKLKMINERLTKNDISYKNNAISYMKIQSLKYINRNINKINRETFTENVHYDLIKSDDKFITIDEFEQAEIDKIINSLKEKINIQTFNTSKSTVIKTNLSVQVNIEQQIEQQIEKNAKLKLNQVNNAKYIHKFRSTPINIDNINEVYDELTVDNWNIINFKIFDWNINFSELYIYILKNIRYRSAFMDAKILNEIYSKVYKNQNDTRGVNRTIPYYLYDIKNPNHLTILTFIDMIQINKHYYQLKKENKLPEKYSNIIIFDKFYNVVLNHGNHIVELPSFILLLFFKVQFDIFTSASKGRI